MKNAGEKLRELLLKNEILVVPGAYDSLSAKIVEKAGFDAVYMTGFGASASLLGRPDVGLLTLSEMACHAANLVEAVNIPVIADADNGFGNAINVQRAVRLYEKAGVACIQIEDQVAPKKCGHMLGRQVIPKEEMVGKIKAACDARRDDNLMIMARTDARTSMGIEEAIERGKAYEAAGADIIFIESPESIEEMRVITSSFNVPVIANMVERGRTPLLSAKELQEIGYDIAIFPVSSLLAATQAVFDMMEELKNKGTTASMASRIFNFEAFNELVGLPDIKKAEKMYATGRNI